METASDKKSARDSLQDIADRGALGVEPSKAYLERVAMLDSIVRDCINTSQKYAGIQSPTARHFYASVLFTTLVTRSVSLAIAMPHTPWASKMIEHWDYASIAGMARSILEARLALYYLCIDPCPPEEWDCRWKLFNLHDCISRLKLFETLGSSPAEVSHFSETAAELKSQLLKNSYFCSLTEGQQRMYLNGRHAYMLSLEEIAQRAGVEQRTFRFLYQVFSSHVHVLPMAFYRMGGNHPERGRGLPSAIEENYTSLCLSFCGAVLAAARDEIHKLFEGLAAPAASTTQAIADDGGSERSTFKVGSRVVIKETAELCVEVSRPSDEELEINYYHCPSNEIVLTQIERIDGERSLEFFDRSFWNITINNLATTDRAVEALATQRMAYKVDADTRTLSFKVE